MSKTKATAYSFEEFDIDAALEGKSKFSREKGIKLPGTENIRSIYNSRSTSTEEFVIGAVEALGKANRNLMYANMSIEGFEDRLRIAARVSKNVNIARSRGLEGFKNAKPLNPIIYALESEKGDSIGVKVSGFFKKIAQAIITAARHIITMLGNFIKMIVNKIHEMAQRGYSTKYDQYERLNEAAKKSADSVTINSMDWKVDSKGIAEIMTVLSSNYSKLFEAGSSSNKVPDTTGIIAKIKGVIAKFSKKTSNDSNDSSEVESLIKEINDNIEKIENARNSGIIFENIPGFAKVAKGKGSASNIRSAFYDGDKPKQMTCGDLRTKTDDFKILNANSMKYFANMLAVARAAQKNAVQACKKYDELAKELQKESGDPNAVALKKAAAKLATKKLAFDSYIQSVFLESQAICFRYTHTAFIAMKQYLKTGDVKTKVTRGNESYSVTADDLFANL